MLLGNCHYSKIVNFHNRKKITGRNPTCVCKEITLGKLPNSERINYENHGQFCLFANCHNLLLTKSQTAKVCMSKGQLASCSPAACQGLFCNQIVKGANLDSFVGVEKDKRQTRRRRPRMVRCNVINPYHLPKKPSNF